MYTQLVVADKINNKRLSLWKNYYISLRPLSDKKLIELPTIPNNCQQNGHMFYIKVKNLKIRNKLIRFLKDNNITAPFHYVPLHSSEYGKHNTKFTGKDIFTTTESKRLLRLPMFYNLETKTIKYIVNYIKEFFSANER